jgi:hypothetical protein
VSDGEYTELELQVQMLGDQLTEVAERVRLDAVATAFLHDTHAVRVKDYFLLSADFPTRLDHVSSEGKWTYRNHQGYSEPFRIPKPDEYQRLYTIAEVAEIVAKAVREKP